MFDKPIEKAIEWTFHQAFETFGGSDSVSHKPATGRVTKLLIESEKGLQKDKEL